MRLRLLAPLAVAAVAAGALPATAALPGAAVADSALSALAGRYVVTLEPGADPAAEARGAQALGADVSHVYASAVRGFAAALSPALLQTLLTDPQVAAVEPDRVVTVAAAQPDAPYGLDRIDQRTLPLSGSYEYGSTGAGVTAYVIDTGIRTSHRDFSGRAVSGFDAVDGGSAEDCNGHGTHVAGTIGGAQHGVAKAARLVAVRVLDCEGSGATSGVIAGIDWVTQHHQPGRPAVANLSLGGSASRALDTAVSRSIADGVTYAVAAGNGNAAGIPQDACSVSPARVPEAITVGASDRADRAATFSNDGSCVDWFAPGVDITSTWSTGDTATRTISGTSMAAPHVAGAAARYLQAHPAASPATVTAALRAATTKDVVTPAARAGGGGLLGGLLGGGGGTTGSTPNDLLHVGR